MKRANFFVDDKRLEALKHVAATERVSTAELVREGIDRVIRDRMRNPRNERVKLQADLEAYLKKYAGTGPSVTENEIDDIVAEATGKRIKR
jgi:Arc/MetJ-type ribon-helix-helix transcriptional regulator